MTQTFYDAQGNPVDPADVETQGRMAQLPRKVIRRLERDAEEGRQAKAELAQLQKERAFVQAGVPLDDPRAQYFIAGYTKDQNPEAIRQEWQATFGAMAPGSQSTADQEVGALSRASEFIGQGVGQPQPDPLSQRNAELASLDPKDVLYPQKFDAIIAKYGGTIGSMY